MPAIGFASCSECGTKLHATFFCQDCGQPSCCLDCYCRHEARHAGEQPGAPSERPAHDPSTRLEPAH
jgi:hypothetical protein